GRTVVGGFGPTKERADPRRELLWLEGLGDVVVSACLEPGDDVVGVGTRRHHDDRHAAVATYLPATTEPIHPGQHDVDDDDVKGLCSQRDAERDERVLAAADFCYLIAFVLEGEPHRST